MRPLTSPNVTASRLDPAAPANPHVFTILDNLLKALEADQRFLPSDPANPNKFDGGCCKCPLEFCYCFPCAGYRNAVWIRIHNINGKNIWFYIPFGRRDLILSIFSFDNLGGRYAGTHPTQQVLPISCFMEFGDNPAFVTKLDSFGNITDPLSYSLLLNRICLETPFLCTY